MELIRIDKIAKVKKEVKLREWSEMIQACQNIGITVAQWCAENMLNIKTYYYRVRKVREGICEIKDKHEIVPISVPVLKAESQIVIQTECVRIEVPENISPELLRTLIGSLKC